MKKTIFILTCLLALGACSKETKVTNYGNSGTEVVCFGDSLTEGIGSVEGITYPSVLGQEISLPVINLGYSGMTTIQARAASTKLADYKPYMVIIEFGANDMMRRVPFKETIKNMEALVEEVHRLGAIAVIADIGGNPMMKRYSAEFKRIADEKKAVFIPGIMDDVFNDPSLKSDEVHPNSQGYTVIALKVLGIITPYLKGAKNVPQK